METDDSEAEITKAKQDIKAFETALSLYRMDNHKYPTTDQGLQALAVQPNDPTVRNWKKGGYVQGAIRKDPWGNDYVYEFPGKHNSGSYDLYSMGPDMKANSDDDISNWQKK